MPRKRHPEDKCLLDLFDKSASEAVKVRGMSLAAAKADDDLTLARKIAKAIALHGDGTCDADEVGKVLYMRYGIASLGPAAGSLFKGDEWKWTGKMRRSVRVTNHGRRIMLWRLAR